MFTKTVTSLMAIVLMLGVLTSCSEEDQGQGQSANGDRGQRNGDQGQNVDETVSGVVTRVDLETNRFVVRPDGEGTEPVLVTFNPESLVPTLDGEEATLEEIQDRRKVEVGYVTENDRRIARTVSLRSYLGSEVVTGRIVRVDIEASRFVVRPEGEGSEPILIRFNPNGVAPVSNGEQLALDSLQTDVQVKVGYDTEDDRNKARSIEIESPFSREETTEATAAE